MSHEFNVNLGKRLGEAMAADAVQTAAFHIQKVAKQLVNRGRSARKNGRWVSGSTAPEPPFNFRGDLQRSIQVDNRQATGPKPLSRVGPDNRIVPYAARLEFGFVGTDKKGRTINQPARPYMRRALSEGAKKAGELARKAAVKAFKDFARGGGKA
tara:strand:- start:42 stop:506 length:465 start_codon:yes stop_codon:yes gene_type:complete